MGNLEVEYIGFGLRFHRKLGIREFLLSSSPSSIFTLRENLEEYYAGAALTLRIRLQIYEQCSIHNVVASFHFHFFV
jgi:hypothetical protein